MTMSREIRGQIYKVSADCKLISIQVKNKLEFFYLQPRFVRQFRNYLYKGVFVSFTCDWKKFKMYSRTVARIIAFEKIFNNRYHRKFSYYDHKDSRESVLDKINQYQYRMFLDLEMTLQHSRYEKEEIIQVGAFLVDKYDNLIWNYNHFIKPTLIQNVSKRTLQFLNITAAKINNGINYHELYEAFKKILLRYKPLVIVWGNNDKFAIDKSYTINKVNPIFHHNDFLNLQQVLKVYYNFNYELGLFTTAKIFQIDCGKQVHNAYEDALLTRKIFNSFYKIANNNLDFDFEKIMKHNLN